MDHRELSVVLEEVEDSGEDSQGASTFRASSGGVWRWAAPSVMSAVSGVAEEDVWIPTRKRETASSIDVALFTSPADACPLANLACTATMSGRRSTEHPKAATYLSGSPNGYVHQVELFCEFLHRFARALSGPVGRSGFF